MSKSKSIQLIIKGKDRVSKTLKSITSRLKKWGAGALKITGALVAGFGLVTGALAAMFSKLADSIDEQAKIASSLGITNEALGVFRDAAGYAGISSEGLTTSLRKMSQGIADAATGTGEAKDAIEELGLDAEKLQQMGPEKAFKAIIEKLDQIPNGIKKTGLAMDLFGRSGAAMANLTSRGLKQAQSDADILKLKLTRAQAANVEATNDAWARIKNAAKDFLKYITAILAPGIKKGFDSAFEFIKKQNLKLWANKAALGITTAFQASLVVLGGVAEAIIAITRGLNAAVDVVNKLTRASLTMMLDKAKKDLKNINAQIKDLKDKDSWGWPENAEKIAGLKEKKGIRERGIADTEKALLSASEINDISDRMAANLKEAQGFSTSTAITDAIKGLEATIRELEGKGGADGKGGSTSAKETAGRIEIAFSGTEKAINIAKERTQEFNDILDKTGGIAGTAADVTVDRLGRISSILDDIARKAGKAGSAIGDIPSPPQAPAAPAPTTSIEDLSHMLEEDADR